LNIVWSREAIADLEEAVDYLAKRSALAAEKLATGIVALVERLAIEELDGPEHILTNGERVHGWPSPPFREPIVR
jgi:plasmid stabilization system protein ParE